ncbi:phospholipase D/Transphosphatidylase [Rhodoferax ferrireducens T118]|uniref:Cardiolipin synthase B n=1 Tax=Albidiferax ferrireducens (strain ATCC BAA-621 / DSM 15236 / T118) TaxID=338969 RepID=Q21YW9_ALBFT|nr:cardiolipin synthase ClsB [Rhodoferax ferrireducens]ABD69034.1 phospholipase D/Transphosphatidylase [Rhodoferax ferrireducens T118]WPC68162.1 cardiolipin synthase ClsB [Rhodoferax ferrireducens]
MPQARTGHQILLLQGAQAFFPALVRAIERSAHEVRLETYIFSVEAAGESVAIALEQAARRGVAVYLVMDGVGTPRIPAQWASRFDTSGVKWRIFSPLGRFGLFIPSRWRRLHRKLCVVDGTVAFCGGINVLDDWYDPNYGTLKAPRFDFAVQVTGPLVQAVHETMAQFWWRSQAASTIRQSDFPAAWLALQEAVKLKLQARSDAEMPRDAGTLAHEAAGENTNADLVLRDNLRNRSRIERAYRKAIGAARTEIIIANAYFVPGRKLRKGLMHAAQRGVRVRLLLQGRYEYFMQYHAARSVYGALLAAGVEIHEYSVSFLHAKVAVIDSHWATVGSSNLDPLSLLLAREANVVMDDVAFAQNLRSRLEDALVQDGVRVDPAAYANRPWRQRFLDRVALGVMRVLLFLNGKRY